MPLDGERLIYELLKKGLADHMTVAADVDVDEMERYPTLTFALTGGSAIEGTVGIPRSWDFGLSLDLFHDDLDEAKQLAGLAYEWVWSWDDPWILNGTIPDVGRANEIFDRSIFTRVGTAPISDRHVHHLAGSFDLQIHAA